MRDWVRKQLFSLKYLKGESHVLRSPAVLFGSLEPRFYCDGFLFPVVVLKLSTSMQQQQQRRLQLFACCLQLLFFIILLRDASSYFIAADKAVIRAYK